MSEAPMGLRSLERWRAIGQASQVAQHRQTLPGSRWHRELSAARIEMSQGGTKIERGMVYGGPADYNIWLESGRIRVERSPKETYYRPSINVLFRSAALTYGRRVACKQPTIDMFCRAVPTTVPTSPSPRLPKVRGLG